MRRWISLFVIGLLTLSFLSGGIIQRGVGQTKAPEIEWTRIYGGRDDDWGRDIQQTLDGGYILAGGTKSYGVGGYDAWLLKMDATGILEWTQTYSGSTDDFARVVQQTSDSGYILVGATKFAETPEYNLWLIKVASTGELQWNRTFAEVQAIPSSGQQTRDGGYIITGQKGGHFWLGKLDLHGNWEWNQTLPRERHGTPYDVVQTSDGGYMVVGTQLPPIEHVPANARVVKTDADGHVTWDLTYGGPLHDEWESVQQTPDQGYILAGTTNSYGTRGDMDLWLAKLSASGELQWYQTFGGATIEHVEAVEQTFDGGYLLVGTIYPEVPEPNGPIDGWLIKTNSEGIKEWDLLFNETHRDYVGSVHQTRDGGYIVAGSTYSTVNGKEVWLMKFGPDHSRIDRLTSTLKALWWVLPGGILLILLVWRVWKKPQCHNS